MSVFIGSARIDERGRASGGVAGDQKQTSTNDKIGEVSMQQFYVASKGWYVIRPKKDDHAQKIADAMVTACKNKNLGYDQGNRLGVITHGIRSTVPTECDCSSLVRACVKEATGKDPGNFTTANETTKLKATGLFKEPISYKDGVKLYTGDILVTKTKGHTAIVVSGLSRGSSSGSSGSSTVSSDKLQVAQKKNVKFAKKYKVIADVLNIRLGAGTDFKSIGKIKNGDFVRCYGYYNIDRNGVKWFYVQWGKLTGYVSSNYLVEVK